MEKTNCTNPARNHYKTEDCSAIMGVFLFKDGDRVPVEPAPGQALQFCVGDRQWVECPNGLPDALKTLNSQILAIGGMRFADLPEDWGVIANAKGEVTHRADPRNSIREIHYLGHWDGELTASPVTIQEIGIGPRSRMRKRFSA